MSRELKVGDRVRVYSADSDRGIFTAKVLGPYGDAEKALVDLELPDGRRGSYYRKQLRRLKPRAPKETKPRARIEHTLIVNGSVSGVKTNDLIMPPPGEYRMVELRPGEVPVDRAKLAAAWDKDIAGEKIWPVTSAESLAFKAFCHALGLPESP